MRFALFILFFLPLSGFAGGQIRQLLDENRLDEGTAQCRQLETLTTSDRDALLSCAWIFFRTDRAESAERMMEKIKGGMALPEYRLLMAYGKIKRKRMDDARKLIDEVLSETKTGTVGWMAQELSAEWYEAQGRLDAAGFIYKQVVSDEPRRGRSQWGLGRYYLARGEQRSAMRHLEETTVLWPKHLGSRFNLGVMNISIENYVEAGKWLTECYRLDKADVGVLEQIGVIFEKKGLINDAIRYWQKAVSIKKDAPLAKEKLALHFSDLIDSLMEQKRWAQALAQLETTTGNINAQPKLLVRRGTIYRNLGMYKKGAVDLKAYLNANPGDGNAARELGICYLNLKLMDQAKVYFQKAASLDQDNPFNHAWYGYVLESKGQFELAREEWRRAIDLFRDPNELEKASRRLATIEKKINKKGKRNGGMGMGVVKEEPSEEDDEQ